MTCGCSPRSPKRVATVRRMSCRRHGGNCAAGCSRASAPSCARPMRSWRLTSLGTPPRPRRKRARGRRVGLEPATSRQPRWKAGLRARGHSSCAPRRCARALVEVEFSPEHAADFLAALAGQDQQAGRSRRSRRRQRTPKRGAALVAQHAVALDFIRRLVRSQEPASRQRALRRSPMRKAPIAPRAPGSRRKGRSPWRSFQVAPPRQRARSFG